MAERNGNKKKFLIIGISSLVFICFLASAFIVLKALLKDDGHRRKRQIQRVTLVKPPPPKIKEKPPEPEIKKEEKIVEPEPEEPQDDMDEAEDDGPEPGEELGLDSDSTGGVDGFGLKAKKGGRSLIGSGGTKNLLKRYTWYTRILQEEIREKVNTLLEDIEGIPNGKHRMLLRIRLDEIGNIVFISIYKSSGSQKVDDVVEQAITGFKVSEAPPGRMPKAMKIKVTFKS